MLLLVLMLPCGAIATASPACDHACCTLPQTDTVSVPAVKMGRDIKTVVTVPKQYFAEQYAVDRFPVLYLLHGASGCYSDWPLKADLKTLATRYGMIIACPD